MWEKYPYLTYPIFDIVDLIHKNCDKETQKQDLLYKKKSPKR